MPRALRVVIADGVYHVTNRGNERRNIVVDDDDRRSWYRLLDRVALRCGWRVFAYVLMDNHFHLFLRTPRPNLSEGMHDFESGYAALFNRRHSRSGVLFQGRFNAVAVERDGHAWELSRYVHLNPIRAKLVRLPTEHAWSSYRYYLNPQGAPVWLDWQTVLAEIGGTEAAARIAYRRFVEGGVAEPPENPLSKVVDGWILGNADFISRCRSELDHLSNSTAQRRTVTPEMVLNAVAHVFEVEAAHLIEPRHRNRARDAAVLLIRELTDTPLQELADRFGRLTGTAIIETCRRAQRLERAESSFQAKLQELRRELLRE